MLFNIKNSIGIKVGIASLFCVIGILLLEAKHDLNASSEKLYGRLEHTQHSVIASAQASVSSPLYEFDTDIVRRIADSILLYDEVVSVRVTETTGEAVVDVRANQQADIKLTRNLISPEQILIGQIEIGFTHQLVKSEIHAQMVDHIRRGSILALLLSLVMIGAIYKIVRPMRELEKAVNNFDVASKNAHVPGIERSDEYGSLARSFKALADQLTGLFLELETKVCDRTQELEVAKKRAEEASVAKSQFLANMSHEIRTPMNGVLGMAELLQETQLNDRQSEFVEIIARSGAALVTIINDILDFSKIEAGHLVLEPIPFSIRDCVEDIALLLGGGARERQIELLVRIHSETPDWMVGDAGRIRQILTNLVGNAVKFTHEGYVLIDVKGQTIDGDQATLSVRVEDTGIGIAPDKLHKIFHEFTQAEGSTTREYGGTGLGLSISRQLVQAMGGAIVAESEPGKGSVFKFELQLPVAQRPVVPKPSANADLRSKSVLVVDDLQVNRSILFEQTQGWGLKPVVVDSCDAALDQISKLNDADGIFDVIILDYQMPDKDGIETAKAIKSVAGYADTPILLLSSVDLSYRLDDLMSMGISATLTKPAKMATLKSTLENLISPTSQSERLSKDDQIDADKEQYEHSGDEASSIHVLVAEDNQVNQLVIRSMIEGPGRTVEYVANGQEALARASDKCFDVIFMDVSMPVMDGVAATRAIRSYEAKTDRKPTPIVCLTAHVHAEQKQEFLEAGMDEYLSKPVRKRDLEAILAAIEAGDDLASCGAGPAAVNQ